MPGRICPGTLVEVIPRAGLSHCIRITRGLGRGESLPSGSLREIEQGVATPGIKMMLAGLGTGEKWDLVNLESGISERGGWSVCGQRRDGSGRWEGRGSRS